MEKGTEFQLNGEAYVVDKFIGRGGMSHVHIAYKKGGERGETLAVKFLPPEMVWDKRRIRALKEEFNIISKIPSPESANIIRIYDIVKVDNAYCLIMPYMAGGNLIQRIISKEKNEGKTFSLEEKLRIAREIAYGLAYLHAYDIVHGDVKPQNILFNEKGDVRITDFGLSQLSSTFSFYVLSRLLLFGFFTKSPMHGGTPSYMSPQQLRGNKAEKSDDIYGLGVLLYELFTAHLPYSPPTFGGDRKALIKEHYMARKKDHHAITIKYRLANLPLALQDIILGCLMFDKKDRFPTVASVYVKLDQIR
ncbi:MAG TPA: serine/threonine protein kinase [Candidatus Omnitrophica bacterium]|nr:serine/threonine protein kinase [Candidatus Omnitrophota bacterium]